MLRKVKFWRYGKEMKSMLKVRISYDSEEELKKVVNILSPAIKKLKKHNQNDSREHKLVYIDVDVENNIK